MRTPVDPIPINLKNLTPEELEAFVVDLGAPRYRGSQLFSWIHGKGATTFEEMTNLPLDFRARLADLAALPTISLIRLQTASDLTAKAPPDRWAFDRT